MEHRTLPALSADDRRLRVTAYYFKLWDSYEMPFHAHPAIEIMYAITGTCRIEIARNPQPSASVTLKKGEFIWLDANVPHRLIIEKETQCRMLNVEFVLDNPNEGPLTYGQMAQEDELLAGLLASPPSHLVLRDPEEVYHTLKSLVLELDKERHDSEQGIMVHLLLWQLLIRIARLRKEAAGDEAQQQTALYVRQVIEFLHQNYDRDIRVKDAAAAVNLHPGYLQRLFRAQTGQTLMTYLTGLRMEKAKMLLARTDIPIIEIPDYVGINSRQYFHTLFKKHAGLTPAAYREQSGVQ